MLLDDIIEFAADDKQSVSSLLRKCLILGHRLKNDKLIGWANQELNGYESSDGLPEYRIVSTGAKGYMSGPFGSSINNFPIPSILLEQNHRHLATTVYLLEAIGSYEELMRAKHDTFRVEWPADFVLFYQRKIRTKDGCHLVQAWQDVGKSSFAQVFDAVRNRTLSMALEIRASLGDKDESLDHVSPQAASQIERSVTNNIFGGINVIASGHSSVNSTVSQTSSSITAGDKEQLETALRRTGLPESSLNDLSKAIQQDGSANMGSRVQAWIKENAPKALIGGVQLGAQVAKPVLTELLKQYFGLK
jgi:hypothetical protein